MNNYDKNEKYKDLMYKMKKAVNNEFYYESILLEYAILEDRTESLLRHAGLSTKDNQNRELSLDRKLKIISTKNKFKDKYILKHITNNLVQDIYNWKKKEMLLFTI